MGRWKPLWGADLVVMSHTTTHMTGMEDPAERLGHTIARVENSLEMDHDKIHFLSPFLDSEMLDLNVSCSWCGPAFINHVQSSKIVNEHARGTRPECVERLEDAAETFDNLSASDG
jgi:hypothetical protein